MNKINNTNTNTNITTNTNKSDSILKYFFTVIITAILISIITEKIVINRLKLSEGVDIIDGKCRLKEGYGKLKLQDINIIDTNYTNHTNN